ncbi:RepB family plasmid replication initiator protein [Moritella viscosa]|uniref:RepB family plasmid replication initiator protein n=1 Tax=Moritella viscosa TaxID=80854 RepID=UPI00091A6FA1|nr:RepB family plasmid replication initiator protein [Moritella viscosa]SGZ01309.1 Putative PAS/PAC sensor protein [Moritella viscosa]
MTTYTKINNYEGLSNQTITIPTFQIQSAFFRNKSVQKEVISCPIRKEKVRSNDVQANIKHDLFIYSHLLQKHHHLALNHQSKELIYVKCEAGSSIVKACKVKANHTIAEICNALEEFAEKLSADKEITVEKYVDEKIVGTYTFSIFEKISYDKKTNTLSYMFSEEFLSYLNLDDKCLTIIQISDFKDVKSNKTGASIYLLSQSMSNLDKEKYLKTEYLSEILGIKKNCNQLFNNAFKLLSKKVFRESAEGKALRKTRSEEENKVHDKDKEKILEFNKEVIIKLKDGKFIVWSKYVIKKIAKAVVDVKEKIKTFTPTEILANKETFMKKGAFAKLISEFNEMSVEDNSKAELSNVSLYDYVDYPESYFD